MLQNMIPAWLVFLSMVGMLCADDPRDIDWAAGSEFRRQTLVSNTGQWLEAPLRPILQQLSYQRRIPLFVDRRVDPSTPVSFSAKNLTWEQLLFELGKPHGYCFCRLEGIYYFGPKETAVSLPGNYEKLNRWIKDNRKQSAVNWRRPGKVKWDSMAEPRQLVQEAIEPFDIDAFNLETIPFDVWPAANVHQMPLNLRIALLVVGFDKWFAVSKSGTKMKIVPYPSSQSVNLELQYVVSPNEVIRQVRSSAPDLQLKKENKTTLSISGNLEQVYAGLGLVVKCQSATKDESAEVTFTAELKGKRGSIVATMAQQVDAKLDFDPDLGDLLAEHIEFDVKDATVDEILIQALEGTGIQYRLEQTKLKLYK